MTVEILPATTQRFADAEHALTGGGDGPTCQCQWWTVTNAEFQRLSRDEREGMLREQLGAKRSPALLAYVDGEAAGWVRVGPRVEQPRILRTRAIAAATAEPLDDPGVWAISCFVVRNEHRGGGLTPRLLDAAVAHARAGGARVVEAYPIDTAVGRPSSNELYHGVLSVFQRAGFTEVARAKPAMAVVSLPLQG